jgi:hypothetical protein
MRIVRSYNSNRSGAKVFVLAALALVVGLAAADLLDLVVVTGTGPVPYVGRDLRMDYSLAVLWAAVLGMGILAWPVPSQRKPTLVLIWLGKTTVTLGLMMAYEYVYGVDPDGYYTNAVVNPFSWGGFELGAGTTNIQHLVWLQNLIIPDSYHAAKVTFSYIGLVGIYLFYRAAVLFSGKENRVLFLVFGFYPSILIWSSILGKEPIVFLGIAMYSYAVVGWYRTRWLPYLAVSALGVLVTLLVRSWLGVILIGPAFLIFLQQSAKSRRRLAPALICILVAVPLVMSLTLVRNAYSLDSLDDFIPTINAISQSMETGGSSLVAVQFGGFGDLLTFLPLGVFTVLFRPFPGEIPNVFGIAAGLENMVLLFLLIRAVVRVSRRDLSEPLVMWAMSLTLIWSSLYSVALYQNLGTMARHRLEILPILIGLLLYLGRRRFKVPVNRNSKP